MILGVLTETKINERRVALSTEIVKLLVKKGFQVQVESGAGLGSNFADDDYKAAGARVVSKVEGFNADVMLKVNAPTMEEGSVYKQQGVSISSLYAYTQPQ